MLLYESKAPVSRIHPCKICLTHLLGGTVREPNVSKRIVPVLLDRPHHLIVEPSGLIEWRDDRNNRRVARKPISEGLDDSVRASDSAALGMPCRVIEPLARVVETVLAPWSAVKVDNDLQSVLTSPVYGRVEVLKLTLDVGFT